jgi:hypothetical protein
MMPFERPSDLDVALLLGSGQAEVSCEECFRHLDVYVERELSGEDAEASVPGMGAHLDGCPACQEDHDSLKALLEVEAAWS